MIGGATQTFAAVVTGDGSSSGVTWTASVGTITSAGVYTAPAVVSTTSATVTATSVKDPTKSASVTVPLTAISVNAIAPLTVTLGTGQTQAFTTTVANDGSASGVTWSIGSGAGTLTGATSGGVTYNAPTTVISATATVTLTATSVKDPTKSTTATITLNPITVTIPTVPVAMIGGATQNFTATLTNDGSSGGVTWSASAGSGTFAPTTTLTGVATVFTASSPNVGATTTITATSVKDPSKSASVVVTLTPITIAFTSVNPLTMDAGQNVNLQAVITGDGSASGATFSVVSGGGSFTPTTAAGNIAVSNYQDVTTLASSTTGQLKITSVKDPTKSALLNLILNPTIAISPGTPVTATSLTAASTNTPYSQSFTLVAGTGTGPLTSCSIFSGAIPAGMTFNTTTCVLSGSASSAGTSTFALLFKDSATNPQNIVFNYTLAVNATPLVFTSPSGPATVTGTVGSPIAPLPLTATGGSGALSYSLNSGTLPAGVSIVGGQVAGTPTAPTAVAGNPVTFKVTDSAAVPVTTSSATVTYVVNPVTLVITSTALPNGVQGSPYSFQLTSTGGTGAITWSLSSGSLTGTGLTLSSTGLISGTPTGTLSALPLTFQAQDTTANQQQTVTKALTLTVTNVLTVTTLTLPNATTGTAYNQTLVASGGSGTGYTWAVTSGAASLTAINLSLSSAGVITGTPTAAGTATFTVTVTDSASHTATQNYTINAIVPLGLPTPNPATLGAATTNVVYNGSIQSTGGIAPYTWTVNGTILPTNGSLTSIGNGLSVSSNGTSLLSVTGTPTTTATVSFTAAVKDSTNATVGPLTYTIAVSSTFNVSGNVGLLTGCGSTVVPPVTMVLSQGGTTIQTVTTGSGNFTFTNVPAGSYTITPSISGPSSVFYPASKAITVSANSTGNNFFASMGYTISGTVSYAGTQTGPIYLSLVNTTCSGNGSQGTTISAKGAYTIRGVPPGNYSLQAYMDSLGKGALNTADATGLIASLNVLSANVTSANVTLTDPAATVLTAGPSQIQAVPFNTGALVQYAAVKNGSGVEMATSYTLQWSTSATFATITGTKTLPAVGTRGNSLWVINGLTDGAALYFRASATSAGTAASPFSPIFGPVTIGATTPAGAVTVSGTVSFTGTATGPMYVFFADNNSSNIYGRYIANPVSAQAYTIQIPVSSSYFFVSVIDQNNNGVIDAGDISNTGNDKVVTAITGASANVNLTLPNLPSSVTTTTQHWNSPFNGGTTDTYYVSFKVAGLLKQPIAVALTGSTNSSGANVVAPMDLAACGGSGSSCGGGFQNTFFLSGVAPVVGDTYTFAVTYSDGTSGTVTGTVGAVVNVFASNLAPTTGTSTSLTPTFSWTDPPNASTYSYQFYLGDSSGNTIWQVPSNNSNSGNFSSSIVSLVWNVDPTGGGSQTSVSTLTHGVTYSWNLTVQDANGNSSVKQVQYTP